MKRKGFTLPELFCTILIVGIVSLLFWQIVYMEYTKRAAASKIRKFHSLIKQVQVKAQAAGNDWVDYYLEPESMTAELFMNKYFLPYTTYLNKEVGETGGVKVYLADASSFTVTKGDCMTFELDINNSKPPQEAGKDLFYFNYCPVTDDTFIHKGDIIPYQTKEMTDRAVARVVCKTTPMYCTGFTVFEDFNFPSDYPFKIPG